MPPNNLLIRTGDQAVFNPSFPPAVVNVLPGVITGTGQAMVEGPIVCVSGDESSVVVPGVTYVSPPFAIPGVGTLTIAALNPDQLARQVQFQQKPAILKGSQFTARFSVVVPATQATPGGPVPDPVPMYTGSGQFVPANTRTEGA